MGSQTSLKSQGKSSHSSTIVRNPPKEEVKRRISKDSPEVTKKRSLNLDSGIMKFSSDMFANSDSDQLMIRNIKSNLIKVPDTEIECNVLYIYIYIYRYIRDNRSQIHMEWRWERSICNRNIHKMEESPKDEQNRRK